MKFVKVVSAIDAMKFVNPIARLQHLFDIAAKPIDVDSNILSQRHSPLFLFQCCPECNHYLQRISPKSVQNSCEAKEITGGS